MKLFRKANTSQSAISNVFNIFGKSFCIHSKNSFWENSIGKCIFKFRRFFHKINNMLLKLWRPKLWLFFFNSVDHVDSKIQMLRFVTHNILNLFCAALHFILSLKSKNHSKRTIKENSYQDQ